jgi:hypothetical protein
MHLGQVRARWSDVVNIKIEICGFHGGDYEECRLLGCGAAWILCEPTFRRNVSPPSSG